MSDVLHDPKGYVYFWLEKNKENQHLDEFSQLYLDYVSDCSFHAITPKSIQIMSMAYGICMNDTAKERMGNAIKKLACHKESLTKVKEWLMAVTGKVKEEDLISLAHWMWQVKRMGLEQPIVYDLVVILHGAQASGKSTALHLLAEPLGSAQMPMDVDELIDSNNYPALSTHLAIVLDEMTNLSRVDANKFKKVITSRDISYRKFFTQQRLTVKRRASFIGTSNNDIGKLFHDSTGMRRFYQISAQDVLDRDALNKLDYAEMWRGIDEKRERGYFNEKTYEQISKVQQTYVNREDVEEYFIQNNIKPAAEDTKLVSVYNLYQDYYLWSKNNGFRFQVNRIQFKRYLEAHKVKILTQKDGYSEQHAMLSPDLTATVLTKTEHEAAVIKLGGKK